MLPEPDEGTTAMLNNTNHVYARALRSRPLNAGARADWQRNRLVNAVDRDLLLRRCETTACVARDLRRANEPAPYIEASTSPVLNIAPSEWPWTLATTCLILVAVVAALSCLH